MLVVVGSDNPVKVRATENVFRVWVGECEVVGKAVRTDLPSQPIGFSQTLEGAVRRAQEAIKILPEADFSVGIEAGLIRVPYEDTRFFDQQFVAVLDSDGLLTLGGGPSFEHPADVAEEVLRTERDVGDVFDALSGVSNLGRKEGAIGFLSFGRISRLSITEVGISMALVPRLRPNMYRH